MKTIASASELEQTTSAASPDEGRGRVVIEAVHPEIDGGRFAIKRSVGEDIEIEADAFADGYDLIACVLRYRGETDSRWREVPMRALGNDRWSARFSVNAVGRYQYAVAAWIDRFHTWQHDLTKRPDDDKDLGVAFQMGAQLITEAAARASGGDAQRLKDASRALTSKSGIAQKRRAALDETLTALMSRYDDRRFVTHYDKGLTAVVDRERARFSAWYEFFPRSCSKTKGKHATFKDCEAHLSYVKELGFDVVYFPPIHPIGRTHRKGRNNSVTCTKADVGSPWAIGSEEGGHTAIHPQLGTLEEFRSFVAKAGELGMEVALDIAFQCAPDHPYVKQNPIWFRQRPDGSVQYAENPPKKYQDIYPFDFESEDWRGLWEELRNVFLFWVDQGIRIFRVDNPHTKPFAFWEWLIDGVKRRDPDVLFLAEAFTRPKIMYRLGKLGFTQSYTYFTWRNNKWDLTEYFTELTQTDAREFFRPNAWPNTPDILHEYLQTGGRPAFMARFVLASTLAANYGIYGPAFELCDNRPREPGSEEYLNSEKYEIRQWDLNAGHSLRELIARVNRIRRNNPALHSDRRLQFHEIDNDMLIGYSKSTPDLSDVVLVVVNLDPRYTQSGWISLPLTELGFDPDQPYQAHDLLNDARYIWHGPRNYVELNPQVVPAHVFRLRRRVRTEGDFDYYL